MSMSASLTRLMRCPNSVTSSSAVSWSMVWVSVTGLPILNRALTRSAPRSAMRLASSWTVIASGTTTSRTCLADGPASMWWRFSFSRARRSAASERARLSSSSESARVTVSLPRWRWSSPRPRLGRAGSGRRGRRRMAAGAADACALRLLRWTGAAAVGLGRSLGGAPGFFLGARRASSAAASSALRFSSARRRSSSLCALRTRSSRRRASSSEARRASSASRRSLV